MEGNLGLIHNTHSKQLITNIVEIIENPETIDFYKVYCTKHDEIIETIDWPEKKLAHIFLLTFRFAIVNARHTPPAPRHHGL